MHAKEIVALLYTFDISSQSLSTYEAVPVIDAIYLTVFF